MMKTRMLSVILVSMTLCAICTTDLHAQWRTDGMPVCTFSRPQSSPRIITDSNGDATITWTDIRNATLYWVYTQKLDVDGNCQYWCGSGKCVYCGSHAYWAEPVHDGSGGAIHTYAYYSTGHYANTVAKRIDGSGSTLWETRLCTTNETQGSVCSVTDGDDGAICIWNDIRNGDYDIYAQRVDNNGSLLWSADGDSVIVNAGTQRLITAVYDRSGGAIIIWRDNRDGNYDIYAQRVADNGDLMWVSSGRPVCTDVSDQEGIVASSDGAEGAIVAWYDDRNGNNDIFAQRIDYRGHVLWTVDGVAVCSASGDQDYPKIIYEPSYSAIIAWTDERDGNSDIYAQRMNSSGVGLWTANGKSVCTELNDQYISGITTDESYGAIIAWTDYRIPGQAVYAQRVDGAGDGLWEEDGVYVVEGRYADIATDRDHGAILAYVKTGGDGYEDIYAQRLFSDGTIITSHADSTYPAQNEMNVTTNTNIYVHFDMEMDHYTLNDTTVIVTGRSTGLHSGSFSYDYGTGIMTFNPAVNFSNGELVTVVLTSDIESSVGVALEPYVWSFTTEADGGGRTFPTRNDYLTGNYPLAVYAADLDNDGDLDVVTANLSDSIYVHPNNGNGTLAAYTRYYSGSDPNSICAVDIDLDGDLDLVTTNVNSHEISIFMNTGSGTFAPAANRPVSANPASIAPADVDMDGYVDLVVANRGSDDIAVFLNVRGSLWYDSSVKYPVVEEPRSITAADFDNDGDLDVAASGRAADSMSVLMNLGDGTFGPHEPYYAGDGPSIIVSGDLDGDGWVDLVVGNSYDVDAVVLLNNGDGTFGPPASYALYDDPRSICTGDFDDDGDPDLAVGLNMNPGNISILANEGNGTFYDYDGLRSVGGFPNSIFAADLDNDGDVDLAVNDQAGDHVTILLNDVVSDVPESDELPKASALFQNHPNPFNPTTEIRYSLHRDIHVRLAVYNILGQHVITLVDEHQQAGYRSVDWNAQNQAGNRVASGVYFYKLQAGDFVDTKKMILLR